MTRRMLGIVIAVAVMAIMASPASARGVKGTWLSETGDTKVRIAACGSSLCGTIVWVKTLRKDIKNPNRKKRGRPLVGIRMIYNLQKSGKGGYEGELYNYLEGKTYTGKMELDGTRLKLTGCVLGGLICRKQMWTKSR